MISLLYCTEGEPEAQRGSATCPRSHSDGGDLNFQASCDSDNNEVLNALSWHYQV